MMRTIRRTAACLITAILATVAIPSMAQNTHTLPYVLPASNGSQTGFVRIVNQSAQAGTVRITAIDDTGSRFGPITLNLNASETVNFNSRDLEQGNAAKGLSGGAGDGSGSWRLILDTALNITPLAYIRTTDGFLTSMHDVAPETEPGSKRYRIVFFNPGANRNQVSRLRLINPGTTAARIVITGRDDAGMSAPGGSVSLSLPAGGARTLTAQTLETGGEGITGNLGDGAGKWNLTVSSNVSIDAVSLLQSPTGHLANLSALSSSNPVTGSGGAFQAPEMVTIPAGSFMMGSPDSETNRLDNEGPVHQVTIAYSFDVGKYEVTRGEFARFVSETSYTAAGNLCWLEPTTGWTIEHNWRNPGFTQTDDHPVVCVTWFDAKAYVAWLSEKTGDEYRLLTESEWEYVARGGTTTPWFWGDSSEMQCRYANALDASTRVYPGGVGCNDGYSRTAPVGSYRANPFGVHDMAGNVMEWVEDCGGTYRCLSSYEPGTDRDGNATPPVDGSAAPEWGTWRRARRGGSWGSTPQRIRSAWRGNLDNGGPIVPSYLSDGVGFRIARTRSMTIIPQNVCPAEIEPGTVFVARTTLPFPDVVRNRILPGDRFIRVDDPEVSGTFTYRRTGANTATGVSTTTDERCDNEYTCTTMTTGTFRANCNVFGEGSEVLSGTWEIQIPPTLPPEPEVDPIGWTGKATQ